MSLTIAETVSSAMPFASESLPAESACGIDGAKGGTGVRRLSGSAPGVIVGCRSVSRKRRLVPPEGPPDGPGELSGVLRYRAGTLVDVVYAEGEVLSRYRERRPLREGWPFHQKVHRVEAD